MKRRIQREVSFRAVTVRAMKTVTSSRGSSSEPTSFKFLLQNSLFYWGEGERGGGEIVPRCGIQGQEGPRTGKALGRKLSSQEMDLVVC